MNVKCPRCKTETVYTTENKFRPFCSDRCKLIDLGEWAEGRHVISDSNDPLQDIEQKKTEES